MIVMSVCRFYMWRGLYIVTSNGNLRLKGPRWRGGGGEYSGFQWTGMIKWGQNKNPKKSLGIPTKPHKIPGLKLNLPSTQFQSVLTASILSIGAYISIYCVFKGDVTRGDSQRRFLAQHIFAMLEQCYNYSKQCRNNVPTLCCAKNRRCESSRVTSP